MRSSVILIALIATLALLLSACSSNVKDNVQNNTNVTGADTQKTAATSAINGQSTPNPNVSQDVNPSELDNVSGDLAAVAQY